MEDGTGYDPSGIKAIIGVVLTKARSWIDTQATFQSLLSPLDIEGFGRAVEKLLEQIEAAEASSELHVLLGRMLYDIALSKDICPKCRTTKLERRRGSPGGVLVECPKNSCDFEAIVPWSKLRARTGSTL